MLIGVVFLRFFFLSVFLIVGQNVNAETQVVSVTQDAYFSEEKPNPGDFNVSSNVLVVGILEDLFVPDGEAIIDSAYLIFSY